MSEQITVDDYERGLGDKIAAISQGHLACALLLDTSGSMAGAPIQKLNEGLRLFKENVSKDPMARDRVDVALVTFDSSVQVLQDFVPVTKMDTPMLTPGGRTMMAEGVLKALELVQTRTSLYQAMGTPYHNPWIFMITDGASMSEEEAMQNAVARVTEAQNGRNGKLTFWAIGVGDYDSTELYRLTDMVVELDNVDFCTIFDWLSTSMTQIANSRVGTVVEPDKLPNNAKRV